MAITIPLNRKALTPGDIHALVAAERGCSRADAKMYNMGRRYIPKREFRKIRFGEALQPSDERLRSSGGSCCHPGGWFPIPYYEVGDLRSHKNSGLGLRRPVKKKVSS
jgi:hypothetical protein